MKLKSLDKTAYRGMLLLVLRYRYVISVENILDCQLENKMSNYSAHATMN
jgi:hypothetical protein